MQEYHQMIRCPKCGHENPDNAMNCAKCRINLQFALQDKQWQAEWQAEKESAAYREQRAREIDQVIVTTTPTVQGQVITQYLGIVSSIAVLDTGLLDGAIGFQVKLNRARETVLQEIKEQAVQCDGDAIVGFDVDYLIAEASFLLVSAIGTAVKLSSQVAEEFK